MGRSKNRNNKESISYSDRNKKEYLELTYPKLKQRAREAHQSLKKMKELNAGTYLNLSDNYGGIKEYMDLVSTTNGWEFKEAMPSKRNCGYNQEAYTRK